MTLSLARLQAEIPISLGRVFRGGSLPNRDHLCAGRNVRLHVLIIDRSQIIINRPTSSPQMYDSHA